MKVCLLVFSIIASFQFTLAAEVVSPEGVIVRSEGIKEIATNLNIAWKVYENDTIMIELKAPTLGWVGVGFGTTTSMTDADFYYVEGSSFVDAKGVDNAKPVTDPNQHGTNFSVTRESGITTMKFTRSLDTGDSDDYVFVPGQEVPALWAYGDDSAQEYQETTNRGFTTFTLTEKAFSSGINKIASGRIVGFRAYNDGTTKQMVFEFTAPTVGWLGIGFGVSRTMVGADIVYYAAEVDNGPWKLKDSKASKNGAPIDDASQDATFLKYTSGVGTSTIRFVRKFNTGDNDDFVIPDEGTFDVIWSCGHNDILDYHGKPHRGSITLNISNTTTPNNDDNTGNSGSDGNDGNAGNDDSSNDGNNENNNPDGGSEEDETNDNNKNDEKAGGSTRNFPVSFPLLFLSCFVLYWIQE